mmetsp:Transcript_59283/g.165511  ORF Transcript_59283/g.165511 Transcript_59283/m.165511 type:complete len:336 (-) Transcript_59283:281-1288(-)
MIALPSRIDDVPAAAPKPRRPLSLVPTSCRPGSLFLRFHRKGVGRWPQKSTKLRRLPYSLPVAFELGSVIWRPHHKCSDGSLLTSLETGALIWRSHLTGSVRTPLSPIDLRHWPPHCRGSDRMPHTETTRLSRKPSARGLGSLLWRPLELKRHRQQPPQTESQTPPRSAEDKLLTPSQGASARGFRPRASCNKFALVKTAPVARLTTCGVSPRPPSSATMKSSQRFGTESSICDISRSAKNPTLPPTSKPPVAEPSTALVLRRSASERSPAPSAALVAQTKGSAPAANDPPTRTRCATMKPSAAPTRVRKPSKPTTAASAVIAAASMPIKRSVHE